MSKHKEKITARVALERANARLAELQNRLAIAELKKEYGKTNRVIVRRRDDGMAIVYGLGQEPIFISYKKLEVLAEALPLLIPHLKSGPLEVAFRQVPGEEPAVTTLPVMPRKKNLSPAV